MNQNEGVDPLNQLARQPPEGEYISTPRIETTVGARYFSVQNFEKHSEGEAFHVFGAPFRFYEIEEATLTKAEPSPAGDTPAIRVVQKLAGVPKGETEPLPVVIRVGRIDYVLDDSEKMRNVNLDKDKIVNLPTEKDLDRSFCPKVIKMWGKLYLRADLARQRPPPGR